METVNKLPEKGEKLKKYLDSKEHTEILLLDLLRNNELSQKDYEKLIKDSEQAYRLFLDELTKKPAQDNQIALDFDNE